MQRFAFDAPFASERDLVACRAALRDGSKTFLAASYLLPRKTRDAATALYAFCRLADDAVDGQTGGRDPLREHGRTPSPLAGEGWGEGAQTSERTLDTLRTLRERLDAAYDGRPRDTPQDRALADVVHRYAIPRALPQALLEGLEWDAHGRFYPDICALDAYAARVAGSVGTMMARLMGATDPATLARACDLGIAMQFTNIARDVGEDARNGRLYLPILWMEEAGLDAESFLANPRFTPALGEVIQRLLDAADALYARSASGIAALPAACRPGIHAARLLYAQIGREVEKQGLDSVARRAFVPTGRKAVVLARILATLPRSGRPLAGPTRAQAHFLVEAMQGIPMPQSAPEIPWWNLPDRWVGVIELFEKLERRERGMAERAMSPMPAQAELQTGG